MTDRHALLIGVPGCTDPLMDRVPEAVIQADVTRMRDVLLDSGYEVTTLGTQPEPAGAERGIPEHTAGWVTKQIKEVCRQAPPGGRVLVYFTGHGVNLDGQDYLVPADAHRLTGDDDLDPDTLVPLDPARYLRGCRAGLVVFLVDACRDSREGGFGDSTLAETRANTTASPPEGAFVLITGCQTGQVCGYDEHGSYFTQTLVEILDRRHPARTVQAVFDHVEARMRRRSARSDGPGQQPDISYAYGGLGIAPGNQPICAGEEVFAAWQEAVRESPLWQLCPDAASEQLRAGLVELVEEYARQRRDAQDQLARIGLVDDWTDHDYPVRVTKRITQLFEQAGAEAPAPSPIEVGLLVAVPFLREAVLAEGLTQAAMITPALTDLSRTHVPGPRSDLEITHSIHQHMCHRAEGLAARGRAAERDTLAMWLVHRWVTGRRDLWDSHRTAELRRRLAAVLLTATTPAGAVELWTGELADVLAELGAGIGQSPAAPVEDTTKRCAALKVRVAGVSGLLALAGVLAVDIRRLAPVVADHVGIRDALDLDELRTTVTRAGWNVVDEIGGFRLDLEVLCTHPAVHRALTEVAEQAEQIRAAAAGLLADSAGDAPVRALLPAAISAEGVLPASATEPNQRRYELPLLRFRLSDDKVKELLMGRQLYGDPTLALRELYQNALDACRYRQMRQRYLTAIGRQPPQWRGRITFVQGVEDGQPYIECRDNGVGMDAETLKSTFAQAGQRFVHGERFRREQARWQRADPNLRLIPNSQFGIGVFSYFMLADEISIWTRATDENAEPVGDTLRIDISSSGSLFRLRRDHGVREGGTTVRLLLTGEEKVSVRRVLGELVMLPEFDVEVREAGREPEHWPANHLRYDAGAATPLRVTDRVWWVPGEGGLTADGLRTDQKAYGFVVDLRDRQRPRFSVDRTKLRDWDRAWVADELARGVDRLPDWPGLTLRWLWSVTSSRPDLAQRIYQHLVSRDIRIPLGGGADATPVDLSRVGCLPLDQRVDPDEPRTARSASLTDIFGQPTWLSRWRRAVLFGPEDGQVPVRSAGFPVPDAVDGHLLEVLIFRFGVVPGITVEDFSGLVAATVTPSEVYRRLLRLSFTGLDVTALRDVAQLDLERIPALLLPVVVAAAAAEPGQLGPMVPAALARASHREDLPLGELLDQLRDWLPPDDPTLRLDLAELAAYVCTADDLRLFSRDLDGEAPWLPAEVSVADLRQWTIGRPASAHEIWRALHRFTPLGYRLPAFDAIPNSLTELESDALNRLFERGGRPLDQWDRFALAGRHGLSIGEMSERLRRLEEPRLLVPLEPHVDQDRVPERAEAEFVDGYPPGSLGGDRSRIVAALVAPGGNWDKVAKLRHPEHLLALACPAGSLSVPELLSISRHTGLGVANCLEALTRLHRFAVEQPVTELVEAEPHLRPHHWEVDLLCATSEGAGITWRRWWPLRTLAKRTRADGTTLTEVIESLDRYRPFGVLLPRPDQESLNRLAEARPDELDSELLALTAEESRVSALYLVRECGRLGLTPQEGHQRLAAYVPLGLTFAYDPAAVPDDLVRWQDLILLTTYFDGAEPAVTGVVSAAHVRRCAELVEESPAWVRDRLRHYAPLFDLTVPAEEPADG
ncbi:caspase family protein [Micromonospora echinospora]|uniref:HD domain-containing protein n=1 Tax=Micromonospora echinospora TaxID=1877 RepID=UPI0037BD2D3B